MGWLEKGGYRIGITSNSGTYYYYAHLESYSNLKEGDVVEAGELLGYMGDSGYVRKGRWDSLTCTAFWNLSLPGWQ